MTILSPILPIFFVILLGWAFHRMGFIPQAFLGPGNRLVFYLAIPAMIFRSIAKATITTQFDIRVVLVTLMAVLIVFSLTWFAAGFIRAARTGQRGTFVQSAFHGNIGYIALAIAFYALGNEGLVRSRIASVMSASIIKLIVLPGLGFLGFRFLGLSAQDYLPGLILLATPTATIAVVMAHEIDGDMDFAVATVSVSTLLSAISFWCGSKARITSSSIRPSRAWLTVKHPDSDIPAGTLNSIKKQAGWK
jgi:predicted permease